MPSAQNRVKRRGRQTVRRAWGGAIIGAVIAGLGGTGDGAMIAALVGWYHGTISGALLFTGALVGASVGVLAGALLGALVGAAISDCAVITELDNSSETD